MWKGTNGGQVFSFSGCDDHQVSTDTEVTGGSNQNLQTTNQIFVATFQFRLSHKISHF